MGQSEVVYEDITLFIFSCVAKTKTKQKYVVIKFLFANIPNTAV